MGIRLPGPDANPLPPRGRPAALTQYANVFDQSTAPLWPKWKQHALPGNDGYVFTAPVAATRPTPGACTTCRAMCGNGCLTGTTRAITPNPHYRSARPETGSVRVRRGGSWHTWAFMHAAATATGTAPQTRYTLVGMRLLREWAQRQQARLSPGLRPAGFTLHQANPSIKTSTNVN